MDASNDPEFGIADWQRLLRSIGEDPSRQGLAETPGRVSRAWAHWTRGYKQDPATILKTFADGGESYDELIVVRQIPVYSHCEHHLAPFFGHATVGYLPSGHIVGLSKLTRLVNCFAARLQVQERLTAQIAQSLLEHLQPKAVGVIIRCRHMCMESRGIAVAGEETVTSAMLGNLKTNPAQRAEFLALAERPD
ncbi:GTP cyclohydrolase I FolE [Nitrosovibrio tenuis]|uniref:GTP cyclohydrolase 1 n=1 Tax=Nitrosovibrio tenuis TaxID=1233 RepID=A0A1H7GC19_9PROT|nr:GTP cyclohydrolase I FolE [Nitrosovibrio tenuis]SEK34997.1 GTP cyclohydrolase I [Nitrosovibrio tenuis]